MARRLLPRWAGTVAETVAAIATVALTVPAVAKDDPPPSSTGPYVIVGGDAACTPSGITTTCTTSVASGTSLPVEVSVSNAQNAADPQFSPLVATITGSGSASNSGYMFFYGSFGQPPNDTFPSELYVQGSSVSVTNEADLTFTGVGGTLPSSPTYQTTNNGLTYIYQADNGGALVGYSRGGDGFPDSVKNPDVGNFNGAQGGPVTMTNNGSLTVIGNGQATGPGIPLIGIDAVSIGANGASNKTGNTDYAGTGGSGGAVEVDNYGTIAMSNSGATPTYAILATSLGGLGTIEGLGYAYGGSGNGGSVNVYNYGSITNSAPNGVGIYALSLGGDAVTSHGDTTQYYNDAGNGGAVTVEVEGGGSITMSGDGAGIGVVAASAAGRVFTEQSAQGGDVTVTVDQGGTIDTSQAGASLSVGILAVSSGSIDDVGPFGTKGASSVSPGEPGSVSVTNNGTINTAGSMAVGIAALSVGGASIVTNAASGSTNVLGDTGDGYGAANGAGATVTNNSTITTLGAAAHGIAAISAGGGGGLLNLVNSNAQNAAVGGQVTSSGGGNGASASVTNNGSIVTGDGSGGGDVAIGVLAQSIGGGGGSSNAPPVFVGGKDTAGEGGGAGGVVDVTTNMGSQITTKDTGALGILAQSIGGGGGNGANAAGLVVAVGGQGGNGGAGGDVTVNLDNQGEGGITTLGTFAVGVIAQSIGGGGGHGGNATTVGTLLSNSIGGRGGSGGNGGDVEIDNIGAVIATSGNVAAGQIAQSIGGGGGSGGMANSYDVGLLTIAVAVGGDGGVAGNGGGVQIYNDYFTYTGCPPGAVSCSHANAGGPTIDGADAIGILAQSIGGGGGTGGSATAKSLTLPSEDVPLTVAIDFAVGGKGGSAGYGESVDVANASWVVTGGDGAYGILAQSIGGGGGNAGDSTAAAYAIEGAAPSLKMAVALGGKGGSGGDGGSVTVTNGSSTTCPGCNGESYTYGQNAAGILAQSIGGGGGTGTTGNASASSPNLGDNTGTSVDVVLDVGGRGGNGGTGSQVLVTNDRGSVVVTAGSGSQGIVAQSIGGGGGLAGGGQAGASGDSIIANVSVGGNGGGGGNGGVVTVENDGSILTGGLYTNTAGLAIVTGGDGVGILAQSIGGGGGLAGSSDAAATVDAEDQIEDALNDPSNSYSANISVGGKGGVAGNGNTVQVTNTGLIRTRGIRAYGIEAQSIGGGGGGGGAATSTSNSVLGGPTSGDDNSGDDNSGENQGSGDNAEGSGDGAQSGSDENGEDGGDGGTKAGTYSADVSISGTGGAAGTGGSMTVANSGAILTAGYGAHAILAQSIGGGGGVGAEGTVDNTSTIGLGEKIGGSGGSGGDGGSVSITNGGLLWTAGDDAYGILAQSIGGGGGLASAGCSNSAQVGPLNNSASLCLGNSNVGATVSGSIWNDSSDFTLDIGGVNGTYGNANAVTVSQTGGAILTTGARAFGIAAQSVAAGGGLFAAADVNVAQINVSTDNPGNGGSVNITLGASGASAEDATITTYGAGAFGILAQSIGGGGGFAGDSSLPLAVGAANAVASTSTQYDTTSGGPITLSLNGNITTHGANAHGIFAQSLGDGGGAFGNNGQLFAGNNPSGSSTPTYNGGGGAITITQTGGVISTVGEGSIGIFAQSSGNNADMQNPIDITIGGSVTGGTGAAAAGIAVSGGVSSGSQAYNNLIFNTITINPGGFVGSADGATGTAIAASDSVTNVVNNGTVTGSIDLGIGKSGGADPGSIQNNGTLNSGPSIVAWNFTNEGVINPGGPDAIATTTFATTAYSGAAGNFLQGSAGTLAVDIDALAGQTSDLLAVQQTATIDGTIAPKASRLLPGTYDVASAGSLTSNATAASSLLFDWTVMTTATMLSISPEANLQPSGVSLSGNERSVAGYLQRAWNAGGSDALAPLFGALSSLESASDYRATLDGLSGSSLPASTFDQALSVRKGMDTSFSCPVFEGQDTLLHESDCAWSKVVGTVADYSGSSSYDVSEVGFRLGAQKGIGSDWFVGATSAYTNSWADANDQNARSVGQIVDGTLALKYNPGPWYIGAGVGLGYGWYDNDRTVAAGGESTQINSDSDVVTVTGRLRAAYEVPFAQWYLRPFADFDVTYSYLPGYHENGPDGVALNVRSQNQTTFGVSPMLEGGGRIDLSDGWLLRPYAAAGMVILSSDHATTQASLQGAPASAGTFTVKTDTPDRLGRLDVGLQLYQAGSFDVRLDCGFQGGHDYTSQSGSARIAYHF